MFDGKHVSRRAINLGSKQSSKQQQQQQSDSNTNTARLSVLQEAQQKREQRQLFAKRNAAAIALQRIIRGFLAQKHLAIYMDSVLLSLSNNVSSNSSSSSWLPLASKLMMRTSSPLNRIAPQLVGSEKIDLETMAIKVLLQIADRIHSTTTDRIQISTDASPPQYCSFIVSKLIHYILHLIHRHYHNNTRRPTTSTITTEEQVVQLFTLMQTFMSPHNPPFHFQNTNQFHSYWIQVLVVPFYQYPSTKPAILDHHKTPLLFSLFHTLTFLQGIQGRVNHHPIKSIQFIAKELLDMIGQACTFLESNTTEMTVSSSSSPMNPILSSVDSRKVFATLLFTCPPTLFQSFVQRAFTSITTTTTLNPPHSSWLEDYTRHSFKCASMYFHCPSQSDDDGILKWFFSMLESFLQILLLPTNTQVYTNTLSSSSSMKYHVHNTIQTNVWGKQVILVENVLLFLQFTLESTSRTHTLLASSFRTTFLKYLASFLNGSIPLMDEHKEKMIFKVENSHRICIRILTSCVAQDGGVGGKTWTILQPYAQGVVSSSDVESRRYLDLSSDLVVNLTRKDTVEDNNSDEDDDDDNEDDEQRRVVPLLPVETSRLLNSNNPLLESLDYSAPSLPSRQKKAKPSMDNSWRLTKEDLRTASKLDSLYNLAMRRDRVHAFQYLDHLLNHKNDNLEENGDYGLQVQSMAKISLILGEGELLVKICTLISASSNTTSNEGLDSFVLILSLVLSSCSGIHSRQNGPQSTILSKFAFNNSLLVMLWKKISCSTLPTNPSQDTMTSKIVFCDLFAHFLLAMDDDDFLQRFTALSHSPIRIEDVIIMLKDGLWDVYWTKPVTRQDIFSSLNEPSISSSSSNDPSFRLRYFLSGTKLFNDLYERWSRLVNSTVIFDESSWWFSSLPLLDDSGAVSAGTTTADGFINSGDIPNEDVEMEDHDMGDDRAMHLHEDDARLSSSREETQHDALASCFKDPKLARILTSIPQVLPFDRRAKMFHALLNVDKEKRQVEEMASMHAITRAMLQGNADENTILPGREQVKIRRDALYQDSRNQLSSLGKRLRRQVKVSFVNQLGANEAGIDGGGVFREFLDDLIKDAFDPSISHENLPPLFSESSTQLLCINLSAKLTPEILKHYEFCGQIIGKAVYESVLVEAQFCLPFLNQLLGKHNSLDDLKNLDPDFHRHVVSLRHMKKDEIESLGLTFEMGDIELVPNGSQITVTKDNVIRYIHLIAHRRLNQDTSYQTRAFLKGFRDLIPAPWVRLFSARELQKIIGGDDSIKGIDVDGLKAAMQYSGGYHPSQPIIHWFWEVISEMSALQQRKFLKFMTSCSRQPLLGFQSLIPLPCIQQIRFSESEYELLRINARIDCKLPSSSTCMNLLKLPNYPSKQLLKSKIVYAIESGSGFELS